MSEPNPQGDAGLEKTGLAAKTVRGGLVTISAQIVRLLVQIAGTSILARLLAPADFGLVAMATTVTAFVGLFTDLGLSTATIQRNTLDQKITSTLFFLNLAIGLALMALAVVAAPVAAIVFHDARLTLLVCGLALALPLSAATAQHNALLMRELRMGTVQSIGILSQVAGLFAAALLAWKFDAGPAALVLQAVAAAALTLILTWIACPWRPSLDWSWRSARSEIRFGLYLTGFNFLNYFHRQFDNILIGWRYGSTELGYYSRAYNLLALPITVINSSISQAAVPALSRLAGRRAEWESAFLKLSTVSALGGAGLCAAMYADAQPVVLVVLGGKWLPVVAIFRYLVISSLFATVANSCGWAFISRGQTREFFRWSLIASPIFVLSFVAGLPWGSRGVALAYSTSMAILAPIYILYSSRHTGYRASAMFAQVVPVIVCAAASALLGQHVLSTLTFTNPVAQLVTVGMATGTIYVASAGGCLLFLPQYDSLRRLVWSNYGSWMRLRREK